MKEWITRLALTFCAMTLMTQHPLAAQEADDDEVIADSAASDEYFAPYASLPASFKGAGPNIIVDEAFCLDTFFIKLLLVEEEQTTEPLRIAHIGDSHIRGLILPHTTRDLLKAEFSNIDYCDYGINGATCRSYLRSDALSEMLASSPDLVILSFGTNEGYDLNYNAERHYAQIGELVARIRETMPDVPLLFTTPPGCYQKNGTINRHNTAVAETICRFAEENECAVYDLYAAAGGEENACKNWVGAQMMQRDRVHYTPAAYKLQGQMLFDALMRAYNLFLSDLEAEAEESETDGNDE